MFMPALTWLFVCSCVGVSVGECGCERARGGGSVHVRPPERTDCPPERRVLSVLKTLHASRGMSVLLRVLFCGAREN